MDNQIFGELLINILDQAGKKILSIKFEKTTEHFSSQIDLSGQPKGMYLINLLIDKYLANRKVIVE
jgi:2',3'-cyclic-nucleotide 2'-phosphodiesterase (5'-nucleotidase family)